jgi:phage terminase large subunit-like protein
VWAAGNVWLPQSAVGWSVEKAVAEGIAFPKGSHDDWIDMAAHAVLQLVPRRGLDTFRAMSR